MRSKCIRCGRYGGRNSVYFRKADSKKVVQFRCSSCRRTWTPAAENLEKHQRLRSENETIRQLLVSGVTIQRTAWILKINPKTVARRISYLAKRAESELRKSTHAVKEVYVDELITFEHTRCKPLAVFMAVSKEREILGFRVSSMPPIGKHLRKISHKKYGWRPNHRNQGVEDCLVQLKPRIAKARFKSDEEPSYRRLIRRHFPKAKHETYPSKRAVIAGQGELKDHSYDPIFPINHTFAMLRASLSRLIRRTWCTTKKVERLRQFLTIYAQVHNTCFISQAS